MAGRGGDGPPGAGRYVGLGCGGRHPNVEGGGEKGGKGKESRTNTHLTKRTIPPRTCSRGGHNL